ncbi:MAG: phosphatase PAP2 family protein [Chitinophagales bacterium]
MKDTNFLKNKLNDWFRDITSLANPLILIFVPFIFLKPSKPFYILLIALLINEILGSLIKIIFPKTRPNGQKYDTLLQKIDAGSFPSLHSSRISLTYLTMFSYADNLWVKISFLVVIALVMISRVQLKKHFITDVLGGLAMGIILWYLSVYVFVL